LSPTRDGVGGKNINSDNVNITCYRRRITAITVLLKATDGQGCRWNWILTPIPIPYPQKNLWESPHILHTHRTPKSPIPIPRTLVFLLDAFLNNYIYAVHVTVLLYVFSNDNEEEVPVKQVTNWTVFGETGTGMVGHVPECKKVDMHSHWSSFQC